MAGTREKEEEDETPRAEDGMSNRLPIDRRSLDVVRTGGRMVPVGGNSDQIAELWPSLGGWLQGIRQCTADRCGPSASPEDP